jgi:AraC family transcriptional regulator of adaptative response/methylated-DNA-[protein]-cysteine methyltransferase
MVAVPAKSQASPDEIRWAAVIARDASFDGQFYFSVATTGIYCRPGCPARRPKRENVRFHATCAEAEAAGFRPCKRCRPGEPALLQMHTDTVAAACRIIEASEETPTLEELARAVGVSPFHFHRMFKAALGVTPRAYAAAKRNERLRTGLPTAGTVTAAIYEAGFNSNGRFYANSDEVLGMTPTDFRAGGAGHEIRYAVSSSSLGPVLVAASGKGICAIFFGDDHDELRRDLRKQFPHATLADADPSFEAITAKVVDFIEEPSRGLGLPLDIRGTAFQHRVWDALKRIPLGTTRSYTDIAKEIGAPTSARAVARACATNPVAVAIPCHRVVRTDGSLSGYRGGVDRKRALLTMEKTRRS